MQEKASKSHIRRAGQTVKLRELFRGFDPLVEWAGILRWFFPAITLVALAWVVRLQIDTAPGATNGTHTFSKPGDILAGTISPTTGCETWVIPFASTMQLDTLLSDIETTLKLQRRCALSAPDLSPIRSYRYRFNAYDNLPPLRLLFGDDPPPAKISYYSDWIDSLADVETDSFAFRETVRGVFRLAQAISGTGGIEQHKSPFSLAYWFAKPLWKEEKASIELRLGKLAGADSVAPVFHPPFGEVRGSLLDSQAQSHHLHWLLPLLFLPFVVVFFDKLRRDRTGWLVYTAGAMGCGIWALAIWEWTVTTIDPLLYWWLPIPFAVGLQIASRVRDVNRVKSRLVSLSSIAVIGLALFGGGLVISGIISRVMFATAAIILATGIASAWCRVENALAKPQHTFPSDGMILRLIPFVAALAVITVLFLPATWSGKTLITSSLKPDWRYDPCYIGPLESATAATTINTVLRIAPTAEIYHPDRLLPRRFRPEERRWLTELIPSIPLTPKTYGSAEFHDRQQRLIEAWTQLQATFANRIRERTYDSILQRDWNKAEAPGGLFTKALASLSDPFAHVTLRANTKYSDSLRHDFGSVYDDWEQAAIMLHRRSLELCQNDPMVSGGEWYDNFSQGAGITYAVAYLPPETALQVKTRLPTGVILSGPMMVKSAERDSVIFFILLAIEFALIGSLVVHAKRNSRIAIVLLLLVGGVAVVSMPTLIPEFAAIGFAIGSVWFVAFRYRLAALALLPLALLARDPAIVVAVITTSLFIGIDCILRRK